MLMSEEPKRSDSIPYLMAVICFGLLTVSLIQDIFFPGSIQESSVGFFIVKGIQFGMPLLLGGLLCTGKRWTMMVAVGYGTIGLALDLATFVQSLTGVTDTLGYLVLIVLTGILNFLLILLGGRGVLKLEGPKRENFSPE